MTDHLYYALAWLGFGALHSLLAAPMAKARLGPWLGPWYRLAYNAIAGLTFLAVAGIGAVTLGDRPAFALPPPLRFALMALHGLGWVVLLASARFYDLGRLAGTAQLRWSRAGRREPEDEPLRLDGPHRYVRHPLYSGAFLILWGAALTPLGLATALWGSLYLLIGTALEERKLVRVYGQSYLAYRRAVPAYLPWRGKVRPPPKF